MSWTRKFQKRKNNERRKGLNTRGRKKGLARIELPKPKENKSDGRESHD